ncbi:2'-5' RNA ligase family protein [Hufsiella ginkgonis]|uniref:2'-5' RNA ligase family protein n=1 Tax=Hufsiella ginkgonis TaxID=2695274 RepID=A0A7K1XWA4_9SPHI|nr:2'-5' RNA ligase family protein [Hufsiella ginkgonis]MXV15265.1 hypothetical protein [Hufsiella ginkgonis]
MENLYLLAILPPAQLGGQIHEIREECAHRFNVKAALKPPVHITLFRPFKLGPVLEKHLLRQLSPAAVHPDIEIILENFDSFNVHTLYIRVVKNPGLSSLQRGIARIMNQHKFAPRETKNGNTTFTPHITIAYRDIPAETFPLMWEEYKDRKFQRKFTADGFTLLKHDGKKWQIFKEYRLKQEPEALTLF